MTPRGKGKQVAVSLTVFAAVMGGLAYVDQRVRDVFLEYTVGANGVDTWAGRLDDVASTIANAVKHQSIENGPLMVFAVVGAVLFLFMVKA